MRGVNGQWSIVNGETINVRREMIDSRTIAHCLFTIHYSPDRLFTKIKMQHFRQYDPGFGLIVFEQAG